MKWKTQSRLMPSIFFILYLFFACLSANSDEQSGSREQQNNELKNIPPQVVHDLSILETPDWQSQLMGLSLSILSGSATLYTQLIALSWALSHYPQHAYLISSVAGRLMDLFLDYQLSSTNAEALNKIVFSNSDLFLSPMGPWDRRLLTSAVASEKEFNDFYDSVKQLLLSASAGHPVQITFHDPELNKLANWTWQPSRNHTSGGFFVIAFNNPGNTACHDMAGNQTSTLTAIMKNMACNWPSPDFGVQIYSRHEDGQIQSIFKPVLNGVSGPAFSYTLADDENFEPEMSTQTCFSGDLFQAGQSGKTGLCSHYYNDVLSPVSFTMIKMLSRNSGYWAAPAVEENLSETDDTPSILLVNQNVPDILPLEGSGLLRSLSVTIDAALILDYGITGLPRASITTYRTLTLPRQLDLLDQRRGPGLSEHLLWSSGINLASSVLKPFVVQSILQHGVLPAASPRSETRTSSKNVFSSDPEEPVTDDKHEVKATGIRQCPKKKKQQSKRHSKKTASPRQPSQPVSGDHSRQTTSDQLPSSSGSNDPKPDPPPVKDEEKLITRNCERCGKKIIITPDMIEIDAAHLGNKDPDLPGKPCWFCEKCGEQLTPGNPKREAELTGGKRVALRGSQIRQKQRQQIMVDVKKAKKTSSLVRPVTEENSYAQVYMPAIQKLKAKEGATIEISYLELVGEQFKEMNTRDALKRQYQLMCDKSQQLLARTPVNHDLYGAICFICAESLIINNEHVLTNDIAELFAIAYQHGIPQALPYYLCILSGDHYHVNPVRWYDPIKLVREARSANRVIEQFEERIRKGHSFEVSYVRLDPNTLNTRQLLTQVRLQYESHIGSCSLIENLDQEPTQGFTFYYRLSLYLSGLEQSYLGNTYCPMEKLFKVFEAQPNRFPAVKYRLIYAYAILTGQFTPKENAIQNRFFQTQLTKEARLSGLPELACLLYADYRASIESSFTQETKELYIYAIRVSTMHPVTIIYASNFFYQYQKNDLVNDMYGLGLYRCQQFLDDHRWPLHHMSLNDLSTYLEQNNKNYPHLFSKEFNTEVTQQCKEAVEKWRATFLDLKDLLEWACMESSSPSQPHGVKAVSPSPLSDPEPTSKEIDSPSTELVSGMTSLHMTPETSSESHPELQTSTAVTIDASVPIQSTRTIDTVIRPPLQPAPFPYKKLNEINALINWGDFDEAEAMLTNIQVSSQQPLIKRWKVAQLQAWLAVQQSKDFQYLYSRASKKPESQTSLKLRDNILKRAESTVKQEIKEAAKLCKVTDCFSEGVLNSKQAEILGAELEQQMPGTQKVLGSLFSLLGHLTSSYADSLHNRKDINHQIRLFYSLANGLRGRANAQQQPQSAMTKP